MRSRSKRLAAVFDRNVDFSIIMTKQGGLMNVSKDDVLIELSNLIGKDRAVLLLLLQALKDGYGELISLAHQEIEIIE